jgi:Kef-type K+ transport system membrane component KefB
MFKIILYSSLLTLGIFVSQLLDLSAFRHSLNLITTVGLSYIMIEVGLEFTFRKTHLSSYGKDFLIALTAAGFPWLLCGLYFWFFFNVGWEEAALVSLFAAPTSAGVLFAMLAAAGLAATWLFQKARILAIADDIATLLLMIPFQMAFSGVKWQSFLTIFLTFLFLTLAYRYLHRWKLPTGRIWILIYGAIVTLFCQVLESQIDMELAVIIPAFVLGCMLHTSHESTSSKDHRFIQPAGKGDLIIDNTTKAAFMFLVGCSLPQIELESMSPLLLVGHVAALTVLANLGKLFPLFCYKNEASIRERLALSVALFPRGEVGAGILILAMGYGLQNTLISIAGLSLGLNLLLTSLFISIVIALLKRVRA